MEISTLKGPAARRQAALDDIGSFGRAAAVLALCLAVITPANAAVGDLDVRFGTYGEVAVDGNSGSAVLELPDGRWLVVGRPSQAAGPPCRTPS